MPEWIPWDQQDLRTYPSERCSVWVTDGVSVYYARLLQSRDGYIWYLAADVDPCMISISHWQKVQLPELPAGLSGIN